MQCNPAAAAAAARTLTWPGQRPTSWFVQRDHQRSLRENSKPALDHARRHVLIVRADVVACLRSSRGTLQTWGHPSWSCPHAPLRARRCWGSGRRGSSTNTHAPASRARAPTAQDTVCDNHAVYVKAAGNGDASQRYLYFRNLRPAVRRSSGGGRVWYFWYVPRADRVLTVCWRCADRARVPP